jgi:hypothetical protein
MAKPPKGRAEETTAPTSFPTTSPPPTLDQSFTLPTIMTMQSQLGAIGKQLEHIEKKLDEVAGDVKKHGRWIYAANAFVLAMIALIGFFAPRLWDVLISRQGSSPVAQTAPAIVPSAPKK